MSCAGIQNSDVPDSLTTYLREIRTPSLLTAAEERSLAHAIAEGDKDARSRMIEANLRLVVKIAGDYRGRGIDLDDLIGEGNIGLIRATEEYKSRFGTRFSTYAAYWIKQSIRQALTNTTSTIRLPAHMVQLLTKWRRSERALCRELGRTPSFDEVASRLGLTESQKSLVAKAHHARHLKLESHIAVGTAVDRCPDQTDRTESPHALLKAGDEWDIVWSRLERLNPRERAILVLRYGLEGETPLILKEIGRRLGVTREWVRKIEKRALAKLGDSSTHLENAAEGTSRRKLDKRESASLRNRQLDSRRTDCSALC